MSASSNNDILARLEEEEKIKISAIREAATRFQKFMGLTGKELLERTPPLSKFLEDAAKPTTYEYFSGALRVRFEELCIVFGGVGTNPVQQLALAKEILPDVTNVMKTLNSRLKEQNSLWNRYKERTLLAEEDSKHGTRLSILEKIDRLLGALEKDNLIDDVSKLCQEETGPSPAAISLPLITITQILTFIGSIRQSQYTLSQLGRDTRNICGHSVGMLSAIAAARAISSANKEESLYKILAEAFVTSVVIGVELTMSCSYKSSPMMAIKGPSLEEISSLVMEINTKEGKQEPRCKLAIAAINDTDAFAVAGDTQLLSVLRSKLSSYTKSQFLDIDSPFHTRETEVASQRIIKMLRSLDICYPINEFSNRVLCCSDGRDIKQKSLNGKDLVQPIIESITTLKVDWTKVSIACGGACIIDCGPGNMSSFGIDKVCLSKYFPRKDYICCELNKGEDLINNPLNVCQRCGSYDRPGAPLSIPFMLRAQKKLNELNNEFFLTYDPYRDEWIDEREQKEPEIDDSLQLKIIESFLI